MKREVFTDTTVIENQKSKKKEKKMLIVGSLQPVKIPNAPVDLSTLQPFRVWLRELGRNVTSVRHETQRNDTESSYRSLLLL